MIERYGYAIEADLHRHYGLDLHDFFRGKYPWRKLLTLIDLLPEDSAFLEARECDPQHAERILAEAGGYRKFMQAAQSAPEPAPLRRSHGALAERMTRIEDAIEKLVCVTIAVNSEKQTAVPERAKRPETALARLIDEHKAANLAVAENEIAAAIARGKKGG